MLHMRLFHLCEYRKPLFFDNNSTCLKDASSVIHLFALVQKHMPYMLQAQYVDCRGRPAQYVDC
jgi:hypothetical protein